MFSLVNLALPKNRITNNLSRFATLGAFSFNWFGNYGAVLKYGGSVAHNLIGRYSATSQNVLFYMPLVEFGMWAPNVY